jgi:Tol biopolymer transport system component
MDVLFDLGLVEPFFVSVSPDGRHALFDHAAGMGPRDVLHLDLVTRQATPVVGHPANDAMPVFLPDGRSFLFASDRLGPLSLWRQPFSDNGAPAEPTLVRRDIGRIWAMGMSSGGTFLHGLQTGLIDVHVVRLGDDGRVVEQARPVSSTFAGNNQAPDWSPDGTMLAYAATRGALVSGNGSKAIVIRDQATGQERLVFPDMLFLNAPRWSHDGTRLLVKGRSAATNRWGEFIVDSRTGAMTPAITAEVSEDEGEIGPHQWVPGREAILIGRHGKGIAEVDLVSGDQTMLVPAVANSSFSAGRGVAYSPDGRTLAWSVHERKAGAPVETVLRVRDENGSTRDILRTTMPDALALMAWAPDGRAVYVVRQFGGGNGSASRPTELWRVPVDGGMPEPTGLSADGMRGVAVHPDGRTIAYVTGFATWEIWAMEGIR